jgi:hypothetical protein
MLSVPKSIAKSVLKDHGDIFFEHELEYAEIEYDEPPITIFDTLHVCDDNKTENPFS